MTDYTSIVMVRRGSHNTRILPIWKGWGEIETITSSLSNTISGHVSVDGTPQVNANVYVYYRYNGKLIDVVQTDSNGDYTCNILDGTDTNAYFAVCVTDANYNAIIFDKLTAG